jgi:UDP:flavonoid glycosyltransferase YjiC (YdhE family)
MRVLVAVVPLTGHVAPVSGLVGELVARGHDVRVYTGARHLDRFAGLKARVVPWTQARDFDEEDLAGAFPAAAGSRLRLTMAVVKEGFLGTAPGQVRDLRAELEREPADVLLADSMSFGGMLTGEVTGLPWALVNVLPFNQIAGGPPVGFAVQAARGVLGRIRDRLLWLAYRAATTPYQHVYNRVRGEIGLPRSDAPYGSDLMSPWLVLATGCASLGDPADRLLPQIHYVGQLPAAGTRPAGTDHLPRTSTRPLVVVTQGTLDRDPAELIRPALTGLADLDVEVLATTGHRGQTDVGIPVPANALVVDFADFGTLLPRTAVFVGNGGWGGTLAALGAGVPMVIAPSTAADKPHIARRVARAGAGINLKTRSPTAAAVTDAVRTVLAEPRYTDRAGAVAAELTALGGISRAADLVELLAAERGPVLRPA